MTGDAGTGIFADPRNEQVDALRFRAERASTQGEIQESRRLYAEAACLEQELADCITRDHLRTRSVYAVSAAALWRRAEDRAHVIDVATHFLADRGALTTDAVDQLEGLLGWARGSGSLADVRRAVRDPHVVPRAA